MTGAFKRALAVLTAASPDDKKAAAHDLTAYWRKDSTLGDAVNVLPDIPNRPCDPKLVSPGDVPRRRLGTVSGRCALLHAVAHIEFNAIDLAADMICRFGFDPVIPDEKRAEFVDDWIRVTDDEARHFGLIRTRLKELGQDYGHYPAHNGLWEAAVSTKDNIAARLAIAPMVLEARGLDVTPNMIEKFNHFGDLESAEILTIIYEDEIDHVATGAKWFHFVAEQQNSNPETLFKTLVATYFKGALKPPFNHKARNKAGMPERYYVETE